MQVTGGWVAAIKRLKGKHTVRLEQKARVIALNRLSLLEPQRDTARLPEREQSDSIPQPSGSSHNNRAQPRYS
jgi:hypothetical protein